MTRDLVYGRNAVRELYRGRRRPVEVWVGARAAETLDWLTEGPRPQVRKERELTEVAGSPDHQGVVAWAEPYGYADAWELAARPAPLLCCLDQVTDPRNLGAVIRSAAGAGATGVVLPEHGSARITPVVCRSSAGAGEHLPVAIVPNLARYLADVKGPSLWAYAAATDAETALWDADLRDGVALVLGAEGRGVRPLVRRTCDDALRIPLAHERRQPWTREKERGNGAGCEPKEEEESFTHGAKEDNVASGRNHPRDAKSGEPEGLPDLASAAYGAGSPPVKPARGSGSPVHRKQRLFSGASPTGERGNSGVRRAGPALGPGLLLVVGLDPGSSTARNGRPVDERERDRSDRPLSADVLRLALDVFLR